MERARSGRREWAGRLLSALAVVFLLFDGVIKVLGIAPVLDSFGRLGYPAGVAMGIGILGSPVSCSM
jgi:DoxX-like family